MIKHNSSGAWGVMINQIIPDQDCCLADILNHIGMDNPFHVNAPLYVGGPIERNRVCIVHSGDWIGNSSIQLTPDLYITTDISILAAIALRQGPEYYRTLCGVSSWAPGQLEGEMSGCEPWTSEHRWLTAPASISNVFEIEPKDLWVHTLAQAVQLEVKEWF